jgi:putative transposase
MAMNNRIHRDRRSIRVPGYDYAQPGAYFITICAVDRTCLFGEIIDGLMQVNEDGIIVAEEWRCTEQIRRYVSVDEFVVMPNHVHGILCILDPVRRDPARRVVPAMGQPHGPSVGSIGGIIGQFKSVSTKRINARRRTPGTRVWQRNYFEHIIRDERDLARIREYIVNNPTQWHLDRENPLIDGGSGGNRATHRVAPYEW